MTERTLDQVIETYLSDAETLVSSGHASTVDEIQDILGYGIVDEAVLRDTFFKDRQRISIENYGNELRITVGVVFGYSGGTIYQDKDTNICLCYGNVYNHSTYSQEILTGDYGALSLRLCVSDQDIVERVRKCKKAELSGLLLKEVIAAMNTDQLLQIMVDLAHINDLNGISKGKRLKAEEMQKVLGIE